MEDQLENSLRKNQMKNKLKLLIIGAILSVRITEAQNLPATSDLDSLYKTFVTKHPKLICGKSKDHFDSLYLTIQPNFKNYSPDQRIFEMTRLVASIHDGHSKVGINFDTATHFHQLPVKLYVYEDGIFIRRISENDSIYAGMKVLKIGAFPIDTLIKKILPFIHGENESALKDILPSRLQIPELLKYVKAVSSTNSISFVLEDSLNKIHNISFAPIAMNANVKWFSARNSKNAPPLYLQNINKNYWYTYLDKEQLFYFQFNAVQDMEEISFEKFTDSMFKKINSLPIKKMIIDIRNNNGGDNTLNKYLVHALIRSDNVNKRGKLFVITGRLTFSAAVNLAADLEYNTNAIFVGEPTAAGPNHYGETRAIHLPVSHVLVLYSSQYWQNSFPWDQRTSIEPTIPVKLTSKNYRNNIDPCLNAIKNYKHSN